jgi:hypothetical protein
MAKIKTSEYPVIDHILVNGTVEIEYFTPVAKFRWCIKEEYSKGGYNGGFKTDKILQQLHRGTKGTEEWKDVETVFED